MCERCDLPVIYICCDLLLEQGCLRYGWRRTWLSKGVWDIGWAKTEGRNSYGGVWYMFYGKSSVKQTGPQVGHAVLQLHPALDLLYHGPVCASMQMPQLRMTVYRGLLLGAA